MRTSLKFAVRFLALIAVLGLVSVVLAPATQTGTPYVSALSDLVGVSMAAPTKCPNKQCVDHKCVPLTGWTCKTSAPGSFCSLTTTCT